MKKLDFDTKGVSIDYNDTESYFYRTKVIGNSYSEPYDPNYGKSSEPYQLSNRQKSYYKILAEFEKALKAEKIRFDWDNYNQTFIFYKYILGDSKNPRRKTGTRKYYSEDLEKGGLFPYIMFANIVDGVFCFGGETEDLIQSEDMDEVVQEIREWLNNYEPSCK